MDNRDLMLKISRILPSSFTSCQFKNLSDVAHSSTNPISKQSHHSSLSTFSLKKTPPAAAASTGGSSSWFTSGDDLDADTFFSLSSNSGDSFHLRAASTRFNHMKSIVESPRSSLSSAAAAAGKKPMIATSPDRDEMGFSSDEFSAEIYYQSRRRRRASRPRRKIKNRGGGVIGESYAVEKSSRDPRGDFRASMVEMIVEKQIFAAAELDRLLRCFLSLNAAAYHGIIFEVFTEICQTLFTN